MREPLIPPLMRSNVSTHRGRKVQAPRPSLSLAGSTCTSIHEVELGQCSRFAKRPFAKGPFGKRTAFCAAAVSARQPKAQNAYSPNQPRTVHSTRRGVHSTDRPGVYTLHSTQYWQGCTQYWQGCTPAHIDGLSGSSKNLKNRFVYSNYFLRLCTKLKSNIKVKFCIWGPKIFCLPNIPPYSILLVEFSY